MNSKQVFDNLRQKGHRITPQREQILSFLSQLPEGDHLSVDEIQKELRKKDIKISQSTLYRSLKFLVVHGLLRELDFAEAHKHYEYISLDKPHHHLICNACGKTEEFENKNLASLVAQVESDQKDFKVIDYQLKIFGLCKNCKDRFE